LALRTEAVIGSSFFCQTGDTFWLWFAIFAPKGTLAGTVSKIGNAVKTSFDFISEVEASVCSILT
jgi:hypothetical protein